MPQSLKGAIMSAGFVSKFTGYSKAVKVNILLAVVVLMVGTVAISNASTGSSGSSSSNQNVIIYQSFERLADGSLKPIALNVSSRARLSGGNDTTLRAETGKTGTNASENYNQYDYVAFSSSPLSFAGPWDLRATATVPTGYKALSDVCEAFKSGDKVLPPAAGTSSNKSEELIQKIPASTWIGCTFIVEKVDSAADPNKSKIILSTSQYSAEVHTAIAVQMKADFSARLSSTSGNESLRTDSGLTVDSGSQWSYYSYDFTPFASRPIDFVKPWDLRIVLTIPDGYQAMGIGNCSSREAGAIDKQYLAIPYTHRVLGNKIDVLIQNISPRTDIGCNIYIIPNDLVAS